MTWKKQAMQHYLRGEEASRSSKKAAFPPSTHKPDTTHQKNRLKRQSLNHLYRELRSKHQDIVDAPVELLTDPPWRPDRETDIQIFLSVPAHHTGPAPWRAQKPHPCPDCWRFPHNAWTHVYTDGCAEEGMKNGGSGVYIRYPNGDTTSLSAPGGLQCSNYRAGHLLGCKAHVRMWGNQL